MPAVDSSAILRINYSKTRRALFVTFSSGREYIYFNVPEDLYHAFLAAPSPGQFFNLEIRGRYRFRELAEPGNIHDEV